MLGRWGAGRQLHSATQALCFVFMGHGGVGPTVMKIVSRCERSFYPLSFSFSFLPSDVRCVTTFLTSDNSSQGI